MEESKPERSRREEYTEATRQALLSAGRDIFATEGYQAAGIEAISRAARVTRGAFYHHFEQREHTTKGVVGGNAMAKVEKGPKKIELVEPVLGNLDPGIGPGDDSQDRRKRPVTTQDMGSHECRHRRVSGCLP